MVVLVAAVALMAVMGATVPSFATYYTTGEADGYLLSTGDYHWYEINLSAGTRYFVALSVPLFSDFGVQIRYGTNHDAYVCTLELVASGTNGTGRLKYMFFTARHTGKYYIVVYSRSGDGNYTINVQPIDRFEAY